VSWELWITLYVFSLDSFNQNRHRWKRHLASPSATFTSSPSQGQKSDVDSDVGREKIVTVPNLLCLSRIVLAPYLVHLVNAGHYEWAMGIFAYAGITDLLDGYIARNFKGQASSLGTFLDPLADKILVVSLYLSLTYVDLIPAALTSLVVSRDVLLVYAGLYIRYMSVVPPVS
jgi:cardiolipin synthase